MNQSNRLQLFAFSLFFLLSFLLVLYLFRFFLHVIILAGISAYLLNPLYLEIHKKLASPVKKLTFRIFRKEPIWEDTPGSGAAVVTVFVFLIIILLFLIFLIRSLGQQAGLLYSMVTSPDVFEKAQRLWNQLGEINILRFQLKDIFPNLDLSTFGTELTKKMSGFLYNQLTGLISFTFQSVFFLFIYILITLSLLRFPSSVKKFFLVLSPLDDRYDEQILTSIRKTIRNIFYGNGVSSFFQGFLGGVIFWIFGLNAPLFWAVIMMIFAFIPVLGILFIGLPAAVWLIATQSIWKGILLLILFFLIYFPFEWGLKSKLIAGKSPEDRATQSIYSLLTLLSILGGVTSFGILGIIYGPVILAIFASLFRIYRDITREKIPA